MKPETKTLSCTKLFLKKEIDLPHFSISGCSNSNKNFFPANSRMFSALIRMAIQGIWEVFVSINLGMVWSTLSPGYLLFDRVQIRIKIFFRPILEGLVHLSACQYQGYGKLRGSFCLHKPRNGFYHLDISSISALWSSVQIRIKFFCQPILKCLVHLSAW